jgi:hypothetical protein
MGERLPSEIDIKLKNIVPPPNIYNLDISGCASTGKYISSRYRYFLSYKEILAKSTYLAERQLVLKAI